MTIVISSIFDTRVALVSGILIGLLYGIRFILLKLFVQRNIATQLFIAPRGLITVLLFFAIPPEMHTDAFNAGILLFVIIITSIVMTLALVLSGKGIHPYEDFADSYWQAVDQEIDKIDTQEKAAKVEKKKTEVL